MAVGNKCGMIDKRRDRFEEVITEIVRESGISGRKIARLIGLVKVVLEGLRESDAKRTVPGASLYELSEVI